MKTLEPKERPDAVPEELLTFARSSIAVAGGTGNTSVLTTWSDASNGRMLNFSLSYTPAGAALMLGKRYEDLMDDGTFAAAWDWALIRKLAPIPPALIADADENQGTGHGDGSVRQYTKSTGTLDAIADRQPGPWTLSTAVACGGRETT